MTPELRSRDEAPGPTARIHGINMPAPAPAIDLNCDLGEFPDRSGTDAALLGIVTSANIACGGHAGDEHTMSETIRAALARGVAIGAHPSFPDKPRFGRVELDLTPAQIEREVSMQIRTLDQIAQSLGARITHVKPHGALYHAAMTKPPVAEAIARAAKTQPNRPVLIGLSGSPALDHWRKAGFRVAAEAFADRRYEPDGSLRSRSLPDSLIDDPATAARQALGIAQGRAVTTSTGAVIPVTAQTICIHSDTPNAFAIARAVRAALEGAGIRVSRVAGR